MKIKLLLAVPSLIIVAYAAPHIYALMHSKPIAPVAHVTMGARKAANGDNEFGFSLLKRLSRSGGQNNILISPLSISEALMLAYNGAKGRTAAELSAALHRNGISIEQADRDDYDLREALLTADPNAEIDIANGIWANPPLRFSAAYSTRCKKYFDATATITPLNGTQGALTINGWVNDKTRSNIPRIVSDSGLSGVTAVLINAVYFHGLWQSQFDPTMTQGGSFTNAQNVVRQVPMMRGEFDLSHMDNDLLQAASIPYKSGRLRMMLLLPKTGHSVNDIVESLSTGLWPTILNHVQVQKINLQMPKFEAKATYQELNSELEKMGMPTAFRSSADYSGTGMPMSIERVIHGSVLKVDERGTTATAVTAILAKGILPSMIVDHPFVLAIYDSGSGSVLFLGVINDPTK